MTSYIRFDNEHVGDIIDGEKRITIRRGEPFLEKEEVIELRTAHGNVFANAVVERIQEVRAEEVPGFDFKLHKNYDHFGEFAHEMQNYYDEIVEQGDLFHIISFSVLE